MKQRKRICGMALALVLLLQTLVPLAANAAQVNGIEIPDNWAHDALVFAVENGILQGDEKGSLNPTQAATRAEMAAMMVRIFSAERQADISMFTDCAPGQWYYSAMAAAVEQGFFNGTSPTTLSPDADITREQAFTVIARAFMLEDGDTAALSAFSDAAKVSDYARGALAGMIQAEYVNGDGGCLRPKDKISRQELAQVLYKVICAILRDGGTAQAEYQNLLYAASQPLPEGTVIHGDLVLTCAAGQELSFTDVRVEGRLIVRGETARTVRLENCDVKNIIIFGDTTLSAGEVDKISIQSGDCTLESGTELGTLEVAAKNEGATIALHGSAQSTVLGAWDLTLRGSGSAGVVTLCRPGYRVSCAYAELRNQIDGGIRTVTSAVSDVPELTRSAPDAVFRVKFTNVDRRQVYGVPDGVRTCTLQWYVDGMLIHTQTDFRMTEGAVASYTYRMPFAVGMAREHTAMLRVSYQEDTLDTRIAFQTDPLSAAYYAALGVKTIHVEGTVTSAGPLYSSRSLSGTTGKSVKAGDIVYFLKYDGVNWVELKDGTRGYLPGGTVTVSSKAYYSTNVSYSKDVCEAFVNEVHDYDSATKYLIWCNLYTQTVHIFQGSKGNWKLIKSTPCATGANTTPTRPGVYTIYSRTGRWNFDNNYYYVLYPSLFDGGCAFHTRTRLSANDSWLDSRLGMTITHGCVRMPDEYALWIYQNCALGTRVVIY